MANFLPEVAAHYFESGNIFGSIPGSLEAGAARDQRTAWGRALPRPSKGGFLWLGNAVIQPLERSARNLLLLMGAADGLCGLRVSYWERGMARREWNVARNGQFEWLPKSAGPPTTRGNRGSDKKKPQPRTVGVLILVEGASTWRKTASTLDLPRKLLMLNEK